MKIKEFEKGIKQITNQMRLQRYRRNHHMCYRRPATMHMLFNTPYGKKLTDDMINKIADIYINVVDPEPEKWWDDEYHFGSILEKYNKKEGE